MGNSPNKISNKKSYESERMQWNEIVSRKFIDQNVNDQEINYVTNIIFSYTVPPFVCNCSSCELMISIVTMTSPKNWMEYYTPLCDKNWFRLRDLKYDENVRIDDEKKWIRLIDLLPEYMKTKHPYTSEFVFNGWKNIKVGDLNIDCNVNLGSDIGDDVKGDINKNKTIKYNANNSDFRWGWTLIDFHVCIITCMNSCPWIFYPSRGMCGIHVWPWSVNKKLDPIINSRSDIISKSDTNNDNHTYDLFTDLVMLRGSLAYTINYGDGSFSIRKPVGLQDLLVHPGWKNKRGSTYLICMF